MQHVQRVGKVHVASFRQCKLALLDVQSGVGQYPDVASEAEVLRIIGRKFKVKALVAVNHHRVDYVKAVERYGVFADGTGERILQQTYLVVVQINVREHVFHHRVKYFSCLYEVVYAGGVLSEDYCFLFFRTFPIQVLCYGFINRKRQNELVVVRTNLYLVEQPLAVLFLFAFYFFGTDVVYGQRYLLVFVVLVVVVVAKVGAFLCRYDALHQLYGRVVLSAVLASFGLYGHAFQLLCVLFEGDVQLVGCIRLDGNLQVLVSYGADYKLFAVAPGYGEAACGFACHGFCVAFVLQGGVGNGVAAFLVGDGSLYVLRADNLHER